MQSFAEEPLKSLVGRPSVGIFLILALSKELQKKSNITLALSRCHDGRLVGLILFLGLRKGK
jgi:hypothetical protein